MSKNNGNGYALVSELDVSLLPKGRKFYLIVKLNGEEKQLDVQILDKHRLNISFNKARWIVKLDCLTVGQLINIPENIFTFSGSAKVDSILIRQKNSNFNKSNGNGSEEKDNEEVGEKVEDLSKLALYSYSNKPFTVHISHTNPFGGKK